MAELVDPILVLIACAGIAPMAIGLVREGVRELLEASPAEPLRLQIADAVAAGVAASVDPERAAPMPAPIIRATKLGQRLYVEVDFVVEKGQWQVDDEDAIRLAITERLDELGLLVWATIELTTNPELAAD